jgi:PIN like domain
VKLFIDEDTGTRVARALHALNIATVDWVGNDRRVRKGTEDEDWIPYVGRGGFLLFSCNVVILNYGRSACGNGHCQHSLDSYAAGRAAATRRDQDARRVTAR